MGKNRILVKVHPEGKYVVDLDKDIDINKVIVGARVALRNDSYTLHILLPSKVPSACVHLKALMVCLRQEPLEQLHAHRMPSGVLAEPDWQF